MRAQFQIAANNVVAFEVGMTEPAPLKITYRHSCCPFGWGTIYELKLERFDEVTDVAIYEIVESRSEKP